MPESTAHPANFQALLDSALALLPLRRGTVSERFMKCGKASCACRRNDSARHGPYFSWTRVIDGVTRSRLLSPAQADVVRRQVAAGGEFRKIVEQFWEMAERLADQEIEDPTDASKESPEKGGSVTNSKRRLKLKSRR